MNNKYELEFYEVWDILFKKGNQDEESPYIYIILDIKKSKK